MACFVSSATGIGSGHMLQASDRAKIQKNIPCHTCKAPSRSRMLTMSGSSFDDRAVSSEYEENEDMITKYRERIERLERALIASENRADSAIRDFEQYKKRQAISNTKTVLNARADFARVLLPVLDSYESALVKYSQTHTDPGFAKIQRQLLQVLRDQGISSIEADGAEFDPLIHYAIGSSHHDTIPQGFVCEQIARGYMIEGELLRPAQVIVSTGASKASEVQQESAGGPSEDVIEPEKERKAVELQSLEEQEKVDSKLMESWKISEKRMEDLKAQVEDEREALKNTVHRVVELEEVVQALMNQLENTRKDTVSLRNAHAELNDDFEYFRKQVIQALVSLTSRKPAPQAYQQQPRPNVPRPPPQRRYGPTSEISPFFF